MMLGSTWQAHERLDLNAVHTSNLKGNLDGFVLLHKALE